jgi:hypothetical protein
MLKPGVLVDTLVTSQGSEPPCHGSHHPSGKLVKAGTENAPGEMPLRPQASVGTLTETWVTFTVFGPLSTGPGSEFGVDVSPGLLNIAARATRAMTAAATILAT